VAMQRMTVYGVGANGYLTRGVAVLVSFGHQIFHAATGATDRATEDTVVARCQLLI
jgi:hypothetical protein